MRGLAGVTFLTTVYPVPAPPPAPVVPTIAPSRARVEHSPPVWHPQFRGGGEIQPPFLSWEPPGANSPATGIYNPNRANPARPTQTFSGSPGRSNPSGSPTMVRVHA